MTSAQFLFTYLPPLQQVFGTRAAPLLDGLIVVAVDATFFAVIEAEKQMRLAFRGGGSSPELARTRQRPFRHVSDRLNWRCSTGRLPPFGAA